MSEKSRLERAMARIDAAHAEDPNMASPTADPSTDKPLPYELHYANKMTKYLKAREPNASDLLQLAIRAQHFRRWEVPRDSYPMTKAGYYSWRTGLKKRQAEQAGTICREEGYSSDEVDQIEGYIRKEDLKTSHETQVLEDVACLVFLDDQFEEFEKAHDEEKIIKILQKTWVKMTDKGHELALGIQMSDRAKELVGKALAN